MGTLHRNDAQRRYIGAALSVLVGLSAVSTATAAGGVQIVTKLASVTAGTPLSVTATLRAHVSRCTGSLRVGNTTTQKTVRIANRRVTFNWTIPVNATSGAGSVTITCAGLGSARATFTVAPKPVLASAEVTKSGFSTWGGSQYRFINWGVVLVNNSPDQDAGDVQVTVNVLDASGRIIATDVQTVQNIPAGSTFYAGGGTDTSTANPPPASLQVTTLVREPSKAAHLPWMQASNVTFYPQPFLDGTDLQGQFTNPYSKTLASFTKLTFVAFDASGNVVGGGRTYVNADVPAGGMLGFSGSIDGVSPALVSTIGVSFDPRFT